MHSSLRLGNKQARLLLLEICSKHYVSVSTLVQTFFSMLEESATADKALVKRGLQFRESLTKKYKWDFSSEPEEFAPTVVETSWVVDMVL